jgi:hypothetical protein
MSQKVMWQDADGEDVELTGTSKRWKESRVHNKNRRRIAASPVFELKVL